MAHDQHQQDMIDATPYSAHKLRPGVKTLHIEGLQKSYGGRRVVDGVSFTVQRGEVVGLLGRNGAGKTTSFDMVLGLVTPEKGVIRLEDKIMTKLPIHMRSRMGVAYLPQEASIFQKVVRMGQHAFDS